MRKFFGPMGSISRISIESHTLRFLAAELPRASGNALLSLSDSFKKMAALRAEGGAGWRRSHSGPGMRVHAK
jgi:hypothetical protein